jgi:DNA-binding transcriptional ArsR family regulator
MTTDDGTPRKRALNNHGERDLDLVALKALAHPLRVEMYGVLSTYGPNTASGLAERLGESSGATSYHLRQLEKHGFVREVADRGTSRERWWERTPGAINFGMTEIATTPAGRSASSMITRQFRISQNRLRDDFENRGVDELSNEWLDAATISAANTRLTPAQLTDFVEAFMELLDTHIIPFKNQIADGARPVFVNFEAFPVIDADADAALGEK